jgi:hypothetical protein
MVLTSKMEDNEVLVKWSIFQKKFCKTSNQFMVWVKISMLIYWAIKGAQFTPDEFGQ